MVIIAYSHGHVEQNYDRIELTVKYEIDRAPTGGGFGSRIPTHPNENKGVWGNVQVRIKQPVRKLVVLCGPELLPAAFFCLLFLAAQKE